MASSSAPVDINAVMAALLGAKIVTFSALARSVAMFGYASRIDPRPDKEGVSAMRAVRLGVVWAETMASRVLATKVFVAYMLLVVDKMWG